VVPRDYPALHATAPVLRLARPRDKVSAGGSSPRLRLYAVALGGGAPGSSQPSGPNSHEAVAKTLPVLSPGYPRACPRCGTVTAEDGFAVDRSRASGRKSHCRECDRKKAASYYDAHKDEFRAQREAVREAARQAELAALAVEHKKRIAATEKLHAAQVRRQKEFLRSIGVPDLSPEEVTRRASRPAQENQIPASGRVFWAAPSRTSIPGPTIRT
jgi:hypothetical protein